MNKAAIFDLDGTLIDTEHVHWMAWRTVMGPMGIDLTDELLMTGTGRRSVENAQRFLEAHGKAGDPAKISAQVLETFDTIPERALKPGAIEAIELAKNQGFKTAIATSSTNATAKISLELAGLTDYFDAVISSEHERYGKPHPAVFLTAAEAVEADPQDCVVFEDAPLGVIAAKAARMRCVAIPEHFNHDNPTFAITDVVLSSLLDLRPNHLA